jgi:hypothetical protein
MSKTKTLVLAFSVLTSLAATGLSAGSAQAQTSSGRVSVAASELNSVLDRAEYTGFRGGFGRGFGGFHKFHFHRFDRFYGFKRFGFGGRGFGRGRF